MFARAVVLGVVGIVLGSSGAEAQQNIGTFSWQTQPHCNRVTVTVIQQGGVYQLVGNDDQCGAGPAPVTGTAIPSGSGVAMGLTVWLGTGRAAHLSATIALANLSGTWADADGRTGPFGFSGATGGSPRPAPAASSAILVTQFSPTVYAGTGAAATVSRSDHTHDDRYYTRTQVDSRRAGEVIALGFVNASGAQPVFNEQRTASGNGLGDQPGSGPGGPGHHRGGYHGCAHDHGDRAFDCGRLAHVQHPRTLHHGRQHLHGAHRMLRRGRKRRGEHLVHVHRDRLRRPFRGAPARTVQNRTRKPPQNW